MKCAWFYDSCHSNQSSLTEISFNVPKDSAVVLSWCGLPPGVEIPVHFAVGNPANPGCTPPLVVNGYAVVLNNDNVSMSFTTEGTYILDLSAVAGATSPCVRISKRDTKEEDVKCIPNAWCGNPPPIPCPIEPPVGLVPTWG